MTEPVTGIGRVREAGRKETPGGPATSGKGSWHPREVEDDIVDISEEARSRSADVRYEGDRGHDGTAGN